jgi:glycosyltransferase involved in cell wall biosynthesis
MRVLEVINTLEIGGAERMAVDLACGLARRGHEVAFACLRESGPLSAVLEEARIPSFVLHKKPGLQLGTLRSLTSLLRRRPVDVIHTHNPLVHHYGALAGRMAGVPVIMNTVHGPGNLTGLSRTQLIFEATCLLSTGVVACCEAVHTHVQRVTSIARHKSTVIANGIPLETFTEIQSSAPAGKIVFGSVGRLVPVKDHKSMLKAFSLLRRECDGCRLELLGDGPLRPDLEQYARELGVEDAVQFYGSSLNVADFLRRIHVFVLCSLSEGLPLTVLEAMAAGLPVIGTSVGALPELVERAECGWLSTPNSPDELAASMLAALRDGKLRQVGLRGRRYVTEHYSIAGMVTNYERLFQQEIEKRRPRVNGASL